MMTRHNCKRRGGNVLSSIAFFLSSLLLLDDPLVQYREAAVRQWEKEILAIEARDAQQQDPENAILFIGSSSIRRWESIGNDMAPWPAIQRGYGGAKFSDLAVFVDRIVSPHKFNALVIFVGNDITGSVEDKSVPEVVRLFNHIVASVRSRFSKQPIFLIEITPTPRRFAAWPKIKELNAALRAACESGTNLHFIQTADKYLDADGNPIETYFVSDRLHQNATGYALWSKLIKAKVEQVIKPAKPSAAANSARPKNLRVNQLVAWCIVPFDAAKRGPKERAAMLSDLGVRRLAYDWREEHVSSWDEEVDALAARNIELTSFWCGSSLEPTKDKSILRIVDFLKRRQIKTELWLMLPDNQLSKITDEGKRVAAAAPALRSLADLVRPMGCRVGLYNHGGWIGRPSVMVRVVQALHGTENVGIVYNFHHAHEDLAEFPAALAIMKPYLLCLNLNGTTPTGPKIQPIGQGVLDYEIFQWIRQANYDGPMGILDHRPELDAKDSLQQNLSGLSRLLDR